MDDLRKAKVRRERRGITYLLLFMMLEFTDHFVSLLWVVTFRGAKRKGVEWMKSFRVVVLYVSYAITVQYIQTTRHAP